MKRLHSALKVLRPSSLVFGIGKNRIFLVILLVCGFIIMNIALSPVTMRIDLSAGRAYTLSESSKSVVRNLEKDATITLYASSNLPPQLTPLKTDVLDLLSEYSKAGGSRLSVRTKDPKSDEAAQKDVSEAGIPELQFSQIEQDNYAVSSAYFGIAITYNNTTEIIPQLTAIENLEYDITAALYRLSTKQLPKVGIVGRDPAFDLQGDELSAMKTELSRQFILDYPDIATLSAEQSILTEYNALMVFDNRSYAYTPEQIEGLASYLTGGGSIIAFADGVWVDETFNAQPADNGLNALFEKYGIRIENNLVLSSAAELVNFGNGIVNFMVPYPFWVKTNVFAPESSYFSNISQLTLPWVSSLSITNKDSVTAVSLIRSTSQSWTQTDTFTLLPDAIEQPSSDRIGQSLLATEAKIKEGGAIMVVGTSRFVDSSYLSRTSGNVQLIGNILSEYASGGALAGISKRAVRFYPAPDIPENQKTIFKFATMLTLPVLFGLWGALRILRRR